MIKLYGNLFLGNASDYEDVRNTDFAALHCCKIPYHQELVGYRGNLSPTHPDYMLKQEQNRLALNLVDSDRFDRNYSKFFVNMFKTAFRFIDNHLYVGDRVLIHCNEGVSRSPMILLLYLHSRKLLGFGDGTFEDELYEYQVMLLDCGYYIYPKKGICEMVSYLWDMDL